MNKTWMYIAIPFVVAAVIGSGAALYFYSIQAPKVHVDDDFGETMMVVHPFTRFMEFDKFNTAAVECKLRECRDPAVIVDTEGRTATIFVEGEDMPSSAISPDGHYVIFADPNNIHIFDGKAFTTQKRNVDTYYPRMLSMNDIGEYLILSNSGPVEMDGKNATALTIETNVRDKSNSVQHADGHPVSCDGIIQLIHKEFYANKPHPAQAMYFNTDTYRFDEGEMVEKMASQFVEQQACVGDGKGSIYIVAQEEDYLDDDDTKEEFNEDRYTFYTKAVGEAPKPLAQEYSLPRSEYGITRNGFSMTEQEAWMLDRSGKVFHFDHAAGTVKEHTHIKPPPGVTITDFSVASVFFNDNTILLISANNETDRRLVAMVYDLQTGKLRMTKDLSTVNAAFGRSWLSHVEIRDLDTTLKWLETQPDLKQ